MPDIEPGDVVVQVIQKKHAIFMRKGADLMMKKQITLAEALTGFKFTMRHLDGRYVKSESAGGQVIKPDSLMTASGLGMPFYKKSYQSGNLFITFSVKFPDSLNDSQISNLGSALKSLGKSKSEEGEA